VGVEDFVGALEREQRREAMSWSRSIQCLWGADSRTTVQDRPTPLGSPTRIREGLPLSAAAR